MADVVVIIVSISMAVVIWSYVCGSDVYCGCGRVSGSYECYSGAYGCLWVM